MVLSPQAVNSYKELLTNPKGHGLSFNPLNNTHCISEDIGQRRHDITGSCSEDGVIYKLYKKTN